MKLRAGIVVREAVMERQKLNRICEDTCSIVLMHGLLEESSFELDTVHHA